MPGAFLNMLCMSRRLEGRTPDIKPHKNHSLISLRDGEKTKYPALKAAFE